MLTLHRGVASVAGVASIVGVLGGGSATAQPYPEDAELRFQVWDGSQWVARVEWRAVVNYLGTRTDLVGLGSILYSPIISNADNTGTGAQADQFAPWRNGGVGGHRDSQQPRR